MNKQEHNKSNFNSGGTGPDVFVVTRDKRRTSEKNFSHEYEARAELDYWIGICRQYDPKSRVTIVKTNKPKRIR